MTVVRSRILSSVPRVLVGLALAAGLAAAPVRADLAKAKDLYMKARAEKDPQKQIALYKESIAAQETFEAHYALGETLRGTKSYDEARKTLQKAFELAATEQAKARATAAIAETHLAEGRRQEGIALLRQAARNNPDPKVLERLKAVELEGVANPVTSADISGALEGNATRAFGIAPSVNLRISFAVNSADLSDAGLRQARELGKALSGGSLKGKRFELAGHTDKQGDDAYNDKLSLRRADAVKTFLVREFSVPADSLTTVGKGRRELLYPGDADQDHALNRRVEVIVR
jgi:outer membrane protein OmpA-like peptidoglycan-associated protein